MRTVFRPLIAVAAFVAFSLPSLASAASAATVPTRHLPASGGTIKWAVEIHTATTCTWSSSPEVTGFDGTVKCKAGTVVRAATFDPNTSTEAKDYTLSLTVRGEPTTVEHLTVDEAGALATTTAVTIAFAVVGGPTPVRATVTASNGTAPTAGTLTYTFMVQGFQSVVSLSIVGAIGEMCFVQAIEGGPMLFFLQATAEEVGQPLLALPILCSCRQPTRVLLAICRARPFPLFSRRRTFPASTRDFSRWRPRTRSAASSSRQEGANMTCPRS